MGRVYVTNIPGAVQWIKETREAEEDFSRFAMPSHLSKASSQNTEQRLAHSTVRFKRTAFDRTDMEHEPKQRSDTANLHHVRKQPYGQARYASAAHALR